MRPASLLSGCALIGIEPAIVDVGGDAIARGISAVTGPDFVHDAQGRSRLQYLQDTRRSKSRLIRVRQGFSNLRLGIWRAKIQRLDAGRGRQGRRHDGQKAGVRLEPR